jgi:hypothetical protein
VANRSIEIGRILRAGDSALARRKVSRAIFRTGGCVLAVGRVLGADANTVYRWINRLALEDALAQAREQARERSARASTRVDTP